MKTLRVGPVNAELDANFKLARLIADWPAAQTKFIVGMAERLKDRNWQPIVPADFTIRSGASLDEARCQLRIFQGACNVILEADGLKLSFRNATRNFYPTIAEVFSRCSDWLVSDLAEHGRDWAFFTSREQVRALGMTAPQPIRENAYTPFGESPYLQSPHDVTPRHLSKFSLQRPLPVGGRNPPLVPEPKYQSSSKQSPVQTEMPQPLPAKGSSWLAEAMHELEEIDAEVEEEDLPPISPKAKSEAHRILSKLPMILPWAPTIYPTMDGEIAIQFSRPSMRRAVVIELSNDGEAACFASMDGRNRRARYSDSSDLPDDFVEAQLRALAAPPMHERHGPATP